MVRQLEMVALQLHPNDIAAVKQHPIGECSHFCDEQNKTYLLEHEKERPSSAGETDLPRNRIWLQSCRLHAVVHTVELHHNDCQQEVAAGAGSIISISLPFVALVVVAVTLLLSA